MLEGALGQLALGEVLPTTTRPFTPIRISGFEYGNLTVSSSGGGLFSAISGAPTIDNTVAHSGTYSLKLAPTGSGAVNARWNQSSGNQVAIASGYFRIPTGGLPSSSITVLGWQTTTGNVGIGLNITTTGAMRAVVGGGTAVTGVSSMNLNQWYLIEMMANITATTWTLDWYIDGVQQTQATLSGQVTNDTLQYLRLGSASTTASATMFFDDVVLSETPADFPLGEHGVAMLLPSSDGTHNAGTNVMEKNDGTDIGATTAFNLLNKIPMSDATTYVQQSANGSANYAEVLFADLSVTRGNIVGSSAILAYTSATTTANNGAAIISKDNFTTYTEIFGNPTTPQDYSDGSTSAPFYKSVIVANGDNITDVNNLKARIGYSTDTSPVPFWLNLGVEVAYLTYDTGSTSSTLANLTLSASGIGNGGTLQKTLGALSRSISGTVLDNGNTNKTLGSLSISASGTVVSPGTNGTVNKTLGALSRSANGTVTVQGTSNKTLSSISISSSSGILVSGNVQKTLGSLTLSANGQEIAKGTLQELLGGLSVSARAATITEAVLQETLNALSGSSTAQLIVSGDLQKTLDSLTATSSGIIESIAQLDEILGRLTSSAQGTIVVRASLNKTLDRLTLSSVSAVENNARLNEELGRLSLNSSGSVFNPQLHYVVAFITLEVGEETQLVLEKNNNTMITTSVEKKTFVG